ncbi:signal peptidase I [Cellulomonas soli]|uniref:Signal peptidase I n=1 Tax=Cellulomonas soli TaxID=931535 RepID=A0A512PBC7_9CELL|nr:signal peptidase I [Cellulomonas soli]NYI61078.1 signal peptidase I [Cellulomonas soli]GEP68505.1 signal peptidase I [Cellulomonas soli]
MDDRTDEIDDLPRRPWEPTSAQGSDRSATAVPVPVAADPPRDPGTSHPEGPSGSPRTHSSEHRHAVRRRPSAGLAWARETVIILGSALVLSLLVKTFLVQAFFIPSSSMHDTLVENDRILVSKLTPGPFDLRHGDIVVFKDPGGWLDPSVAEERSAVGEVVNDALTWVGLLPQDAGSHLVKRIIGLPGDHVACAGPGSPVTVNGVAIEEDYLAEGAVPSEVAFDKVVPDGFLWVMGDNRQHSADSRFNTGKPGGGFVPIDNVVGVAFVTVWPLARASVLHNPSDVFADVPAASAAG